MTISIRKISHLPYLLPFGLQYMKIINNYVEVYLLYLSLNFIFHTINKIENTITDINPISDNMLQRPIKNRRGNTSNSIPESNIVFIVRSNKGLFDKERIALPKMQ
jgi:hypothetical protein